MKSVLMKILWILISLLFIVAGIVCLINPKITLSSISFLLGLVLLFSGIDDIMVYIKMHKVFPRAGWVLAEGVLTVVLSFFCLFSQLMAVFTIPMIFSIWILFTGVARIVSSIEFKDVGLTNWWAMFITGAILVLVAVLSLFKPIIAAIAISMVVGIILISQGIAVLVKGYYIDKVIKYIK